MISIESTPAIRPSASVTAAYLGLALEQVGERVAHHVVEFEHRAERRIRPVGDDVGSEVALRQPAERAALAVDQQRVGHFDVGRGQLRRTSAVAWPTWASGASQRSMSATRISASRFNARSAPTKSSTNSSAGLIRTSAGVGVLGDLAALAHDRDPVTI